MKYKKQISRAEALRKIGKYGALTATSTFILLNPKTAAAFSGDSDPGTGPDPGDGRPGSIWKD